MDALEESERPRERCLNKGADCLSLRELLTVLIGSGLRGKSCLAIASDILQRPGTGLPESEMQRAFFTAMESGGMNYLSGFSGLGPSSQARILAAFELGRRYSLARVKSSQEVKRRADAFPWDYSVQAIRKIPASLRGSPQEWIGFVPIFNTGEVGELCVVEKGARTHVNMDPIELFARVLPLRPKGFYLFHNHPSGSTRPSREDLDLTMQVRRTATDLGTRLLGHGIITPDGNGWAEFSSG